MENIEMIEKLSTAANITKEEASAILEANNWDILQAFIALEKQEEVKAGGHYSTQSQQRATAHEKTGKDHAGEIFSGIGTLLRKGNENNLVITKSGETVLVVSTTVFLLLLLLAFWALIPLMVVGLFFGFRYSFKGPDLGKDTVNNVMDMVGSTAESIKQEFMSAYNKKREEEKEIDGEE